MMYDFFCIDIVGSSKDTEIQNDSIKDLLLVIKDFLSPYEEQIQTVFTGDGVIVWFKKDSLLLPLQLALKIHKEFPQIKQGEESCLGLKIAIARGDAIEIDTAKSLVGIPVWGNGPAIVRRLCELCDEGHILLDLSAYENFIIKHKKELEQILSSQTSSQFFQDLGEYFVKHQKSIHVINFCNNISSDFVPLFGNSNFPVDKRGMIDRINIDSELSRPFDTFFEYEGIVLKNKIDRGHNIIFLDESMKNMYRSLFQYATSYNSINTILPSAFLKSQSNNSLLNYQARLRRRSGKDNVNSESVRIMIMEKHRIEKDWENHNTRDACIDFLNWHKDWGVTLLQIEPLYANELRRNIEEATNFQFKSMKIGLWKNKYLIQFGEYQLDDKKDEVRKNNFWISSSNTMSYVNCELLINTLLDHNEMYEIKYEYEKQKPEFIKWNHNYWKPKFI
ncbi:MAG TPA: hypothetical protein VFK40_13890 [Nitrososphaeraceae archaeon]|nr:hypothetical protein [Nitrososphaeraceae archaeon]